MKKFSKILALLLVAAMLVTAFAACSDDDEEEETEAPATEEPAEEPEEEDEDEPEEEEEDEAGAYQIGIIQLVEHPALGLSYEGFIDALDDEGIEYVEDYQNAQNDTSVLSTISQRFVNNDVDLVLAIATGAAQAMASESADIPIVGTAITDYEDALLVDSNEAPGANVTGVSDMNPVEEQIALIAEFIPDIETLGIVYSSNEPNSEIQANLAQEVAESMGIEVEVQTVTTSNDVQQVTTSVAGKVDAIYIPTDNTFANAMSVVAQVSLDTGCPVFGAEESMVLTGGIATLSVSYYDLGYQAGIMAAQILRGEAEPSSMPIQFAQSFDYILNGDMIDALNLAVPEAYKDYIQYPSQDEDAGDADETEAEDDGAEDEDDAE